ncbi:MAG: hybrid sensor histidine kinase/response regulator, partial [Gammaproteobacteria bacterium]
MILGSEGTDHSALNWVKKELDETLKQARLALEAFVENASDSSQLQFCATYLHQARGTLQMVELDGAALLAEELEYLSRALIDGGVERKQDAYEVLMRGIVQLPDYLGHVQSGYRDIPIVLLPLLNDLRALRGEPLLSENALFAPDLSVPVPAALERESFARESGELRGLLRKLRHNLQVGLLGWYRDRDVTASLDQIATVIERLDQLTQLEPVRRLWWVASGLVEALRAQAVEPSVSVKLLLGQMDRQLKRLIDTGEAGLAQDLPLDLLQNLLYYVGRAEGGGARVDQLKQAFQLDKLLPQMVDAGVSGFMGPGVDSLRAVADAVREDLIAVKDILDLFVRGEQRNVDGLERLPEMLRRIADTFGMLGMGEPRHLVQRQVEKIKAIMNGEVEPTDETLTDIAGGILSVESILDQVAAGATGTGAALEDEPTGSAEPDGADHGQAVVNDGEFHLLLLALAREAAEDVAQIKERVVAYLQSPDDQQRLAELPRLLTELKGSFQILNLERAASVVEAFTVYVTGSLAGRTTPLEESHQDALADVIASVEYYLEAVVERRADREMILDRAEQALRDLSTSVGPTPGNGGDHPPHLADGSTPDAGDREADRQDDAPDGPVSLAHSEITLQMESPEVLDAPAPGRVADE